MTETLIASALSAMAVLLSALLNKSAPLQRPCRGRQSVLFQCAGAKGAVEVAADVGTSASAPFAEFVEPMVLFESVRTRLAVL